MCINCYCLIIADKKDKLNSQKLAQDFVKILSVEFFNGCTKSRMHTHVAFVAYIVNYLKLDPANTMAILCSVVWEGLILCVFDHVELRLSVKN